MRSVNKVILVGNLTRDPELKTGANGVATFGVATNRDWVDQSGEKKSVAEFHELVAFGRLAEICHQFLHKGNLVYIEGYLKTRSWIDEATQQKRFRTEVVVTDMIRLEKNNAVGQFAAAEDALHKAEEAVHAAEEGASAEDAFNDSTTPAATDDTAEEAPAAPATEPAAPAEPASDAFGTPAPAATTEEEPTQPTA